MKVGDQAPDFTLLDQDGKAYKLSDHLGKLGTVVFFYPKDNSAVCTAQVCAFRDSYMIFKDRGAEVVGISGDSLDSHRSFAAENRLPFPILSDPKGEVRKLWKVRKTLGVIPGRVTYVIGKGAKVLGIYDDMLHAEPHIQQALAVLSKV